MADSDLVPRARAFAAEIHADDRRKGTDRPYFEGHLEPVADLVRESGGTDVQVAAAYLHDVAEDHGGRAVLNRIQAEFGPEVAEIVEDLSDSLTDTTAGEAKAAWPTRKRRYLAGLSATPERSLEVSLADKLHNARCTLEDLQRVGVALWAGFNETRPEAQLWYYTTLAQVFGDRIPDHPLTSPMIALVEAIERRVLHERPDLADRRPWTAPDLR